MNKCNVIQNIQWMLQAIRKIKKLLLKLFICLSNYVYSYMYNYMYNYVYNQIYNYNFCIYNSHIRLVEQSLNQSMINLQNHREKFIKQKRRQNFERILNKERQNFHKRCDEMEREQFSKIYPKVDEYNYPLYKSMLANFVINPQYSYQISIFAPIVCDYLINHPDDQDSVRILKFISQFEDIQIPQSQQMAKALAKTAQTSVFDSLLICSNLLSYSRYQSLLRDKLIECNYPEQTQELLFHLGNTFQKNKQNLASAMYSQILCVMISSVPRLSFEQIRTYIPKIRNILEIPQTKWNILQAFSTIRHKMKPNKKYADLLLREFQEFIIKQRHGGDAYIIDFLIYAAYSDVYTTNKKILNFILDLASNLEGIHSQTYIQALECLLLYIQEVEFDVDILIISKIMSAFVKSWDNKNRQQIILQVLNKLKLCDVINMLGYHKERDEIILQLIQVLSPQITRQSAILLLQKLLTNGKEGIKEQFEAYGGLKILEEICKENQDPQLREQIQSILNLF